MDPLLFVLAFAFLAGAGVVGFRIWNTPQRRMARRLAKRERERQAEEKHQEKQSKEVKGALAKLRELKQGAQGNPSPPAVPPASNASNADFTSLEEYKEIHGDKIPFELSRLVLQVGDKYQSIVVMRGQVKITVGRTGDVAQILFVKVKKSLYYVNPRRIIRVEITKGRKHETVVIHKLEFDILYAEAMDAEGRIQWDDDLEMILADSALDQYVIIASAEQGFQLTPTIKRAMLIVGFLGFLIGLAINGAYHLVPQTVVHWIP